MPGVSYEQLMKPLQIEKTVTLLHKVGAFFQNFMRMGPDAPPSIVTDHRTFGYDIYANTRMVAGAVAPSAPPTRTGLKPIGQNTVTLVRNHEAISIYDEKVFMSRPVGGRLSEVDAAGRSYIRLQLEHLVQRFRNSREFMISRMLRGGFGLKPVNGESYQYTERSDPLATIVNNYNIPSENFADLGGIIASGEGWDQAGAPIHEHLMTLSKRMAQKSGYTPRHIIMNSSTLTPLFQNTVLQGIVGSSNRIFDTFSQREISPEDAKSSAMYTVVFGALPMFRFHAINEGLVLNEVLADESNQISDTNFDLFIPDGKAIIVPEPDRVWAGYAAGKEPVRERTDQVSTRVVTGFGTWRTPEIDPARYDVKALDNGLPLLFIPRVVHFADVWEPYTSSEV